MSEYTRRLALHGGEASFRSTVQPNPQHESQAASKPALPAIGQLHLTKDGQNFLLSIQTHAESIAFINQRLSGTQLVKQEERLSHQESRISGRVTTKTLYIYQVPASHDNTIRLIELGRQLKAGGLRLTLSNEQARTHLQTHQKLWQERRRQDRIDQESAKAVLPVPEIGGNHAHENPEEPPPILPISNSSVRAPHTLERRNADLAIAESRPNIQVITGRTPATASQATALKIQTTRNPTDPDLLANGYPNAGLYDLIMEQPGAQYVKSRKGRGTTKGRAGYFRVPISETTVALIKALQHQYGLTLESHAPTLGLPTPTAIKNRLTTLKATHDLSGQADLDAALPTHSKLVAPEGLDYLPYQKAGIAYALQLGNALIADEPGLGKTIQAIGVSNALPEVRRILVIVPASLKINWQREFEKWDTKALSVSRVRDGRPDSWPSGTPEVVVINFDLVEQHYERLTEQPWDLLIIDEAHALKNEDAKRTKAILGHGSGEKRTPGIPANRKLFLTGTPILNRPAEIWPLAHALDPDFFADKHRFEIRYCNAHKTEFGWNTRGSSNLPELNRQLRARIMVRRRKAQVLKDLPPKTRQIIELDRPALADHNGQYRRLEQATATLEALFEKRSALRTEYEHAQAETALSSVQRTRYRLQAENLVKEARTAFHQMSEVRKETALSKVPQVVELAKTALANGKIILFCHHAEVVEAYVDALNHHFKRQAGKRGTPATVAVVTGKTPNEQRQAQADRFQSDEQCKVFVGTIQAAGVGLTLTAAQTVLFAELDWVPGNMNQAEDRAHRIGQLDHVLVYHTAVEGSIDTQMIRRLIEKQQTIDEALEAGDIEMPTDYRTTEGRGGFDFADWLQELANAPPLHDQVQGILPATQREPPDQNHLTLCDAAEHQDTTSMPING
ncbi:DEAD/DEAH box helicase [Marinobacter nauticus]|uniref:Helicase domain protein n=1 Tax=Marinobacter nauticus (strain ATCC 700491 / DSM 11845 / VT8) TaxID=351348 RepID=A1U817_MARN8|nr:DEAD/DEAH box helicase [Marinobacter nauticus]ABM21136.1 helicase domain protein [Marinobacter nauticus VT8]